MKEHAPELSEGQCNQVIKAWLKSGLLVNEDYGDPVRRTVVKGLKVNNAKRPT